MNVTSTMRPELADGAHLDAGCAGEVVDEKHRLQMCQLHGYA